MDFNFKCCGASRGKTVCDINDTFNIETNQIENLITERTVGIIPVHLFGLSADMDNIMRIAQKNNLWVVEDAACGFGARYKGQHVGGFGDTGVFSFHPRKAITTGEVVWLQQSIQIYLKRSNSLEIMVLLCLIFKGILVLNPIY